MTYILAALIGWQVVDFGGYWWHRLVEHKGVFGNFILYRHIVHHEKHFPLRRLRTKVYISAWAWSWLVLAGLASALIWTIGPLVAGWQLTLVCWAVACVYGFGAISKFHDWYHVKDFWMSRWAWFRWLTLIHDLHHYGPYNYGIIGMHYDKLFGTFKGAKDARQGNVFIVRDFPKEAKL